jgi:hypothetical protein
MIVKAKVTPRASLNSITKVAEAEYHIRVTVAPEDGKANQKAIELLAYELGVPKTKIKLSSGTKSRTKTFFISNG